MRSDSLPTQNPAHSLLARTVIMCIAGICSSEATSKTLTCLGLTACSFDQKKSCSVHIVLVSFDPAFSFPIQACGSFLFIFSSPSPLCLSRLHLPFILSNHSLFEYISNARYIYRFVDNENGIVMILIFFLITVDPDPMTPPGIFIISITIDDFLIYFSIDIERRSPYYVRVTQPPPSKRAPPSSG